MPFMENFALIFKTNHVYTYWDRAQARCVLLKPVPLRCFTFHDWCLMSGIHSMSGWWHTRKGFFFGGGGLISDILVDAGCLLSVGRSEACMVTSKSSKAKGSKTKNKREKKHGESKKEKGSLGRKRKKGKRRHTGIYHGLVKLQSPVNTFAWMPPTKEPTTK